MTFSSFSSLMRKQTAHPTFVGRQGISSILLFPLLILLFLANITPVHAQPSTILIPFEHTQATVETGCVRFTFSADGNPFPLCPGPLPTGGNCVWWGWEMWHQLGYDLPHTWGNAADWVVDAERTGLPIGTMPRVGSLAVFPVGDGVWAFGPAGHVAFVTHVSPDGQTFDVTYQNYGDPTPMYVGHNYNVSIINQARFQRGQLRFLYFPLSIDPARFASLPGINGTDVSGLGSAGAASGDNGTLSASRVALGLPEDTSDQQFSADFTGTGSTDLLLYDRARAPGRAGADLSLPAARPARAPQ